MVKIAMVEDDIELANVLTQYLSTFDIEVTNYDEPFLALSAIAVKKYDLIILDLTLPGLDGLEVCKKIQERYNIPIIISSARSDITDKITALELGADDYLPKPYDPRELEIRIKTILRRFNKSNNIEKSKIKNIFTQNLSTNPSTSARKKNTTSLNSPCLHPRNVFIKRQKTIVKNVK